MLVFAKRISFFVVALMVFFSSFQFIVHAQTATPSPAATTDNSQQKTDLQNKIKELESKVSDLQKQENSLNSQISVMDNQIKLTEYRINAVENQISELSKDIDVAGNQMKNLEGSITNVTKILLNRIVATYQTGNINTLELLLSSEDPSDLLSRANYLQIVQEHDKRILYDTQQSKNDYANQKQIFENKKQKVEALQKQLEDYTKQLDSEKDNKKKLLSETQGNEANYQRLLSQAKAQLAGFSRFTASQGGASLLGGQTVCDNWGCYYNQRDSQWGGASLNGTQYTLASDGCLVTSMAMVYTHFGYKGVTPQTINSNSNNFASYYPAFLKKVITADGVTSSRVYTDLDSELSAGRPVVVGISYDGGNLADHFVVFVSGSGGNYIMNDPFTPNGHNISFRDRYPTERIVEIEKVVF